MTEDILFDNIYIGHSVEDADKLAKETYFVKHALEEAADKAANKVDEEDAESTVSLKEDPVAFIRQKVLTFVEAAKVDPVNAFKSQPETGAALAVFLATFFGMIGVLLGVVGGSQPPVTKVCFLVSTCQKRAPNHWEILQSTKKTDAPTPDDKKKEEKAPVAPAGGKSADTPVKKRK